MEAIDALSKIEGLTGDVDNSQAKFQRTSSSWRMAGGFLEVRKIKIGDKVRQVGQISVVKKQTRDRQDFAVYKPITGQIPPINMTSMGGMGTQNEPGFRMMNAMRLAWDLGTSTVARFWEW